MSKQNNKPLIRFPQFNHQWQLKKISEITERVILPVKVERNKFYKQIGIRSHGKGIFYKEPIKGKSLGNKRVFWVEKNALIFNIVFAWEQAVAKTTEFESGMIASHRFPMYLPKFKKADTDFLLYFFFTNKGKSLLELASPGGAGRNKTLGQKEFENLKLIIPEVVEQKNIASFLSIIDKKISQLKKKKSLLEQYKKGIMQKIFSQVMKFKDDNGKIFPRWVSKKLGECLAYEQPTNYIVTSTEYSNNFTIPVITAGKTFILGYTDETFGIFNKNLPVIIFDDFTTASQYVNFPFKTKSSAMKILKAKEDINIKFMFEALQMIKYEIGAHGRHWISVFSEIGILIPSYTEQSKIAAFLSVIDEKINHTQTQLEKTELYKKGLLQKMFC